MPISTYQRENADPIHLDADLLTACPKPVQAAAKAYDAAVAKWEQAVLASVELRKRSSEVDHAAAQEALDAARAGKPIPTAKADGISASIEAADRAEEAYLRLAQEAEQHYLAAIDTHHDEITAAADRHAHDATATMLDRIGVVLATDWPKYVRAHRVAIACELGKPWLDPTGTPIRVRWEGQDRNLADLLADVLRAIHRTDPEVHDTFTRVQALRRSVDPRDYDTANDLLNAMPVPSWCEPLGVTP